MKTMYEVLSKKPMIEQSTYKSNTAGKQKNLAIKGRNGQLIISFKIPGRTKIESMSVNIVRQYSNEKIENLTPKHPLFIKVPDTVYEQMDEVVHQWIDLININEDIILARENNDLEYPDINLDSSIVSRVDGDLKFSVDEKENFFHLTHNSTYRLDMVAMFNEETDLFDVFFYFAGVPVLHRHGRRMDGDEEHFHILKLVDVFNGAVGNMFHMLG